MPTLDDLIADVTTYCERYEYDGGYTVDFDLPDAERSVPSTAAVEDGVVTELVVRVERLPKHVYTEEEVREQLHRQVQSVGISTADVTITPGLRREPRKSNLAPEDYWYPHVEFKPTLSVEKAAKSIRTVRLIT